MIFGARVHDYGVSTPEDLFARIGADGFGSVQLAPQKALQEVQSTGEFSAQLVERTRLALETNGLGVGVYGCYVNFALVEQAPRARQVEEFCRNIPHAARLSAGCIGTETTPMASQPAGTTRAQALRALEDSLAQILPLAEAHGVTVGIEPVFYHAMHTPEEVRLILNTMQSKHLRVIFDPVNLMTPQDFSADAQHALLERSMECFGEQIVAVHLKGACAEGDAVVPCPLAQSAVDYAAIFSALRQAAVEAPVFREEVVPAQAKADLAFLRACAQA